ncbi:hypothetical protein GCM10023214_62650 [Amycolatopsis dongchuanensis]|uniref:Uncharacterized protein n=1 Tax=Amycolatopsis dongchuanensis TaxID=1070866 RepID=A0ABP8VHI7_9PSEU
MGRARFDRNQVLLGDGGSRVEPRLCLCRQRTAATAVTVRYERGLKATGGIRQLRVRCAFAYEAEVATATVFQVQLSFCRALNIPARYVYVRRATAGVHDRLRSGVPAAASSGADISGTA